MGFITVLQYFAAVFRELRPKSLTDILHSPAIWVHPPALKTEGHSSPTATDKTCVDSAFYMCGKKSTRRLFYSN
uniref:Uncharacterized protein n=1 Tax=Anguilla anguilla TaxID=7936 RepID=A0A0E9WHP7_ANGAN